MVLNRPIISPAPSNLFAFPMSNPPSAGSKGHILPVSACQVVSRKKKNTFKYFTILVGSTTRFKWGGKACHCNVFPFRAKCCGPLSRASQWRKEVSRFPVALLLALRLGPPIRFSLDKGHGDWQRLKIFWLSK